MFKSRDAEGAFANCLTSIAEATPFAFLGTVGAVSQMLLALIAVPVVVFKLTKNKTCRYGSACLMSAAGGGGVIATALKIVRKIFLAS